MNIKVLIFNLFIFINIWKAENNCSCVCTILCVKVTKICPQPKTLKPLKLRNCYSINIRNLLKLEITQNRNYDLIGLNLGNFSAIQFVVSTIHNIVLGLQNGNGKPQIFSPDALME